jgi:cardiolipin synthase A/B
MPGTTTKSLLLATLTLNEVSDRNKPDGVWPSGLAASERSFPVRVSPRRGSVCAQVQRTVRPGLYSDGTATPGGSRFDVAAGERSCFEQYERAITFAKNYIYL